MPRSRWIGPLQSGLGSSPPPSGAPAASMSMWCSGASAIFLISSGVMSGAGASYSLRFTTIVMLSGPPVVAVGPVPPASPPGCPRALGAASGAPAKLMRLEWMRVVYKALSAPLGGMRTGRGRPRRGCQRPVATSKSTSTPVWVSCGRGVGASGLLPPAPAACAPDSGSSAGQRQARPPRSDPPQITWSFPLLPPPLRGGLFPAPPPAFPPPERPCSHPAHGAGLHPGTELAPGPRYGALPALKMADAARGHGGQGRVRVRGRRRTASGMGGGDWLLPLLRLEAVGGTPAAPAIKSRGGWAARPDEARSILDALAPPSLHPRGVHNAPGVDGGEMSGPLRRRHREGWPGAGNSVLSAAPRLEKGAAGRPPPRRACDPGRRVRRTRQRMRAPAQMRRPRVRRV